MLREPISPCWSPTFRRVHRPASQSFRSLGDCADAFEPRRRNQPLKPARPLSRKVTAPESSTAGRRQPQGRPQDRAPRAALQGKRATSAKARAEVSHCDGDAAQVDCAAGLFVCRCACPVDPASLACIYSLTSSESNSIVLPEHPDAKRLLLGGTSRRVLSPSMSHTKRSGRRRYSESPGPGHTGGRCPFVTSVSSRDSPPHATASAGHTLAKSIRGSSI